MDGVIKIVLLVIVLFLLYHTYNYCTTYSTASESFETGSTINCRDACIDPACPTGQERPSTFTSQPCDSHICKCRNIMQKN